MLPLVVIVIPRRRFRFFFSLALAILTGVGAGWITMNRSAPPWSHDPVTSEISHAGSVAVTPASLPPPANRAPSEKRVTVAIGAEPVRLDPHDTGDSPSALINFHLYDRLVELDGETNVVPALADSWHVSQSGTVWTLHLRSGVRFHDGELLTANVVVANFNRLLDAENALSRRDLLSRYVKDVKSIDERTVSIQLKSPLGPFLKLLAHESLGIVSPKTIRGAQRGEPFAPVGTGPFKLSEWTPGNRLVLSAYDRHWRGPPHIDRLIFLPIPEGSSRAIMVETGTVDIAYPVDPVHASRLTRDENIEVVSFPSQRMMYVALNTKRPPLDDVRVRQALNYAVDSGAITRHLLFGLGQPADAPVAPSTWGHAPVNPYTYDPVRARRLLHAANLKSGTTLEIWSPAGRYPQDRVVAQAIAAFVADLGFSPRIRLFEWGAYLSALQRSDAWHLAILGWVPSTGDADMALRPLFAGGARSNHSGYASERVDSLLEAAAYEQDEERRKSLYREVQSIIAHDAPVLFLYSVELSYARHKEITGIKAFSTEILDLRSLQRERGVSR